MAVVMRGIIQRSTSKMHNRKVELDGFIFDSIRESLRYKELKLQQGSRLISDLEVHPRFDIIVNGYKICTMKPDFSYIKYYRDESQDKIVEDVKSKVDVKPRFTMGPDGKLRKKKKFSTRTEAYRIKRKLMKAVLSIDVIEM